MEPLTNGAAHKWICSQMESQIERLINRAAHKWSCSQMELLTNGVDHKWSCSQMELLTNGVTNRATHKWLSQLSFYLSPVPVDLFADPVPLHLVKIGDAIATQTK